MLISEGSIIKDNENNSYVLGEGIGGGGFGVVYIAHREKDNEIFAVKTLLSSYNKKEDLLSFQKELQQALTIESPNIIKYHYIHDGTVFKEYPPYIIMEYAESGTLAELIEKLRANSQMLDSAFLKQAFLELASGMEAISQVLVHRDIKPENILISNNTLKISDFGLSKISSEKTKTLTMKGYGTAPYIAPEAWNNDKNTIQMDIYSMGIVFYELATLQYPYDIGDKPDSNIYRDAHLYGTIKNPSIINPDLPQSIVSVIVRMLEKPIQKRFGNWKEIVKSIQAEPMAQDDIKELVEVALKTRNESDIKMQEQISEEKRKKEKKEEFCRLIYNQYETDMLIPINDFINRFNSGYSGTSKYRLVPEREFSGGNRFSNTIETPSNRIHIKMEVILKENIVRRVSIDRIFNKSGWREENYIPQIQNRDILAWGQVNDNSNKGFNLILSKVEDSLYGDWLIITNTNSGFGKTMRPEPFGFKLEELQREIESITAMHIYNSEVKNFVVEDIIKFISDRA